MDLTEICKSFFAFKRATKLYCCVNGDVLSNKFWRYPDPKPCRIFELKKKKIIIKNHEVEPVDQNGGILCLNVDKWECSFWKTTRRKFVLTFQSHKVSCKKFFVLGNRHFPFYGLVSFPVNLFFALLPFLCLIILFNFFIMFIFHFTFKRIFFFFYFEQFYFLDTFFFF